MADYSPVLGVVVVVVVIALIAWAVNDNKHHHHHHSGSTATNWDGMVNVMTPAAAAFTITPAMFSPNGTIFTLATASGAYTATITGTAAALYAALDASPGTIARFAVQNNDPTSAVTIAVSGTGLTTGSASMATAAAKTVSYDIAFTSATTAVVYIA